MKNFNLTIGLLHRPQIKMVSPATIIISVIIIIKAIKLIRSNGTREKPISYSRKLANGSGMLNAEAGEERLLKRARQRSGHHMDPKGASSSA